jgi:uncharacterized protein YukE
MSRESVERAGLRYPPGDPEDFTTASRRLARVSADLQTVPGRVQRLAMLGQAWTGAAAERFRAGAARSVSSISDVSAALRLASLAAERAAEALRHQQQAARRLAEQVNDAEEAYRRADREADRAEEHAEQAGNHAIRVALAAGEGFSLAEQVRASREAQAARQEAIRAREQATRARERYEHTKRRAERELRRLEADTEGADGRARSMLNDVARTLSAVADPLADPGCPIDTPVFTTGAGLLPFLTHGSQLARNALANPLGPLAGSAKGNAYNALADGLRETFPGTCIGPEPPTPPSDPPSPRPAPAPADEPNWIERRLDDVKDLPGKAKDVVEGAPGAIEDGYHAYDRWTDDRLEDLETWLEDNLTAPSEQPRGPVPLPPELPPVPLPPPVP